MAPEDIASKVAEELPHARLHSWGHRVFDGLQSGGGVTTSGGGGAHSKQAPLAQTSHAVPPQHAAPSAKSGTPSRQRQPSSAAWRQWRRKGAKAPAAVSRLCSSRASTGREAGRRRHALGVHGGCPASTTT